MPPVSDKIRVKDIEKYFGFRSASWRMDFGLIFIINFQRQVLLRDPNSEIPNPTSEIKSINSYK